MAALGSLFCPIHLHLSAFRSPSCLPKRFPVWHVPLRRDGFLLGSPGCSLGPSSLGDIKTGGHFISDIADDMWKPSIVKTLEKTFPHQSLRISKHDMEGFEERKMDRRKRLNEGHPFYGAVDCCSPLHFMVIYPSSSGNWPLLRTLTWDKPFHLSQKRSGSKLTRVAGETGRLHVLRWPSGEWNKGAGLFWGETLPMKAALLLFPLPVGLTLAC